MEHFEYPGALGRSFQENTLVPQYLIRLFYVEHMVFSLKILTLALFVCLASCSKRDPNPESKDTVYSEISKDLAQAKADYSIIAAQVDTQKADLAKATPQTGERGVFEKRVNDSLNTLVYAKQRVRMYEVRLDERKLYVQRRYLESLTPGGRKWPEEGELESEKLKLKMLREKSARIRNVLEVAPDVPRGTSQPQTTK